MAKLLWRPLNEEIRKCATIEIVEPEGVLAFTIFMHEEKHKGHVLAVQFLLKKLGMLVE